MDQMHVIWPWVVSVFVMLWWRILSAGDSALRLRDVIQAYIQSQYTSCSHSSDSRLIDWLQTPPTPPAPQPHSTALGDLCQIDLI